MSISDEWADEDGSGFTKVKPLKEFIGALDAGAIPLPINANIEDVARAAIKYGCWFPSFDDAVDQITNAL